MKPVFLIFIFVVLSLNSSYAQSKLPKPIADSLWKIWSSDANSDSLRLDAILKYARDGYTYSQPDSALYFGGMMYKYALKKEKRYYQASALVLQGVSLFYLGESKKAIEYYEKALKISETINDKLGMAKANSNLGIVYQFLGDYSLALTYFHKCADISTAIKSKKGMATAISSMAILYNLIGEQEKAINYFDQSLLLANEINDLQSIVSSLNGLGSCYSNMGYNAKAMEYYTKCYEKCIQYGHIKGALTSHSNIGLIYHAQGDQDQAYSHFKSALQGSLDAKEPSGIISAYMKMASVLEAQGKFGEAMDNYTKSLVLSREMGYQNEIAKNLSNMAMVYQKLNNPSKALELINESIVIQEKLGDKEGLAKIYNNQGKVYDLLGMPQKSLEAVLKGFEIALEIKDPESIIFASRQLAIKTMKNDADSAITFLELVKRNSDMLLRNNYFVLSENEKVKYFQVLEQNFGLFFDFASHFNTQFPNHLDTAYNIALLTKGLSLNSSTLMRTVILGSNDSLLIADYNNWINLKRKIVSQYESEEKVKTLENEANRLEKILVKKTNVFSDLEKLYQLNWKQVRDKLKSSEAAIEFVHFTSEMDTTHPVIYAALIVKKNSIHPEMVRLCTEEDLKKVLGGNQGNNFSFVNSAYGTKEKGQTVLYEKIWKPMEKNLEGIKSVYFSPSGLLHKVAFHAIAKEKNTFLCDVYELKQQNSTGKVAFPDKINLNSKTNYLVLGGVKYDSDTTSNKTWAYLPGTMEEINHIKVILEKKKHEVDYLVATNTTEEAFKNKASSANIMHIATHGFFFPDPDQMMEEMKKQTLVQENIVFRGNNVITDSIQHSMRYADWTFVKNKNPLMRSGLALAYANDVWQRPSLAKGEDGILTAQEVSTMNLCKTDLVVLSACETGLGDIKGSEGVFGLQRAFKMAGVKNIIMSLWQVPDKETAEFMEFFYKNLVKEKEIKNAFKKTQMTMRKKYAPYYWAAFVLVE